MDKPTMGEAVPCDCHCHQSVYCPECDQPTGPLEIAAAITREAAARIWIRLTNRISDGEPYPRRDMAND